VCEREREARENGLDTSCACVNVCVYVCMCERERGRERERLTHQYVYQYECVYVNTGESAKYRVATTHRIPYLYRSFSEKVTYIYLLFCGK